MDWGAIGSVATAVGVAIGAWQIRQNAKLNQAQYEDSFDQQYRALAMAIPVDALIGKPIEDERAEEVRELIYNYLDLCNEQIYQRSKKKISSDTWTDWCAGIKANLRRPAFNAVWQEIQREAPGTFTFLEALAAANFTVDPAARGFLRSSRQSTIG